MNTTKNQTTAANAAVADPPMQNGGISRTPDNLEKARLYKEEIATARHYLNPTGTMSMNGNDYNSVPKSMNRPRPSKRKQMSALDKNDWGRQYDGGFSYG